MDLTTGEVAAARGRLSALARRRKEPDWQYKSARDADGARNEVSGDEFFAAVTRHYATLASSWFQVLWCIERIRAGRIVLASAEGLDAEPKSPAGSPIQAAPEPGSPLWILDELISAHIDYLNNESAWSRTAVEEGLGEWLDDMAFKHPFVVLLRHVRRSGYSRAGDGASLPKRWADPISSRNPTSVGSILGKASLEQLRSLPDNFWSIVNESTSFGEKQTQDSSTVRKIMARLSFERSPDINKTWADELRRIGFDVSEGFDV